MKDNSFVCPSCKGHLNVGEKLVFATHTKRNHKGLILLSTTVGEYDYEHNDKFQLETGEKVDFRCPICQTDLTSKTNNEHAMIHMIGVEDNSLYEVYFSKIAGNKSTYIQAHGNIEAFGDDALDFEELFYELE